MAEMAEMAEMGMVLPWESAAAVTVIDAVAAYALANARKPSA
jgi:hypothetical protein